MEDMMARRLNELALRCAHSGATQFTRFLEPDQEHAVRAAANRAGAAAAFWGGWPDAERRISAFYDGEAPAEADYPIRILRITWNAKFANPSHRDLLGALMGLGIERETTGDIAMGEYRGAKFAYLAVLTEIADYIAANLESAGRVAIRVRPSEEAPVLLAPEGEAMRLTVQNPRLDAVLAAACRLSRSEAQRLIAAGLVKLNHVPCLRDDARLGEGDLISARGYGRIRLTAFQGESRRGRLVLTAFRYK